MLRRFFKPMDGTLTREIAAALVIKAALLLVLWLLFFHHAPVMGPNSAADALLDARAFAPPSETRGGGHER